MRASVVVVNYETPELVERCVTVLRNQPAGAEAQIVVVDNASTDDSVARLRSSLPSVAVVEMPVNAGFASGVNAGFAATEGDVVLVVNPDTELRNDGLAQLVEHLRAHPDIGLLAPLLEGPDGQVAPNGYKRFPSLFTFMLGLCVPLSYALESWPRFHPDVLSPAELIAGRPVAHVTGAVMAIRRSAFDEVGGFDERFFLYLEESEFQRRLSDRGWVIALLPEARATHLHGAGEGLGHSQHFVRGALTYLNLQGVPLALSRVALSVPLALSWLFLATVALVPSKRPRARRMAQRYRELTRDALLGPAPSGPEHR